MNLLCIAVDRLHAGYLGCYGNTWAATPACDRLASTGFVFDQATVDSLDLAALYDSLWRGRHVVERQADRSGESTFADVARRSGLRTLLAADDPVVLEHAAGAAFDDVAELPTRPDDAPAAVDVASTHAARAVAAAIEKLDEPAKPFAMWLHLGALGGAWDAPAVFRERYRDEEDPPVPTFTALPHRRLTDAADLDERFGFAQAYAGQLTLLDTCLGGLLEHLDESGLTIETAVVLLGLRGLGLGEHGVVGPDDERLYAESTRMAWIMRIPGGRGTLRRSQALVQPCDLLPTASELLGDSSGDRRQGRGRSLLPLIDGAAVTLRDAALQQTTAETGLRTTQWAWRRRTSPDDGPETCELYVHPDDFWEVNDVADRCPDVVEELAARRSVEEGESRREEEGERGRGGDAQL